MEFTHYVKLQTKKAERRYTVVGLVPDEEPTTLQIGISACSEKDQFNRKKGLLIARGRVQKKPVRFSIPKELGPLENNKRAYALFFMAKAEEVVLAESSKK